MERPKSITVFGILNVIFGALGVLGALCNVLAQGVASSFRNDPNFRNPMMEQLEKSPALKSWTLISLCLGAVASAVMLAGGIGLLRSLRWGRLLSVGVSIYGLISQIVGIMVGALYVWTPLLSQLDTAEGPMVFGIWAGVIVGMLGACLGFVYYGLMLYYMTRPVVKAAFEPDFDVKRFVTPPGGPPYQPFAGAVPESSASPYAPPQIAGQIGTAPSAVPSDDTVATIVPYKNAPALIGYYLGVFSLSACIPFIGIIGIGMAIAAVICGMNGLRRATEHPEAHGRVHAWIGIIGGGLCTILGLAINAIVIFAIVRSGVR